MPAYCIDQNLFYCRAAGVNIASDVMIALISIPSFGNQRYRWFQSYYCRQFSASDSCKLHSLLFIQACRTHKRRTMIVSCLRVRSLSQYASTTKPTYDTLSSGLW